MLNIYNVHLAWGSKSTHYAYIGPQKSMNSTYMQLPGCSYRNLIPFYVAAPGSEI